MKLHFYLVITLYLYVRVFHWIELITFSQYTEGHEITFVLLKVSFLSHLKKIAEKNLPQNILLKAT